MEAPEQAAAVAPAAPAIERFIRIERKHPLAIRWFHWVNIPLLATMIGTGLFIYWSNGVYRLGIGGWTLFHFFPDWFYRVFNLDHRLAEGMAWHFTFMWLFALNGLAFVLYTAISGEWRYLVPTRHAWLEAWQVVLHDLGIRKAPLPRQKFNAAQQITYTAIIVMGALSLLTGLAIYRPVQLSWLATLLGGYQAARFQHFWLTMGFCAFFVVHIAQVIRAGWNNFRSMVAGVEVVDEPRETRP